MHTFSVFDCYTSCVFPEEDLTLQGSIEAEDDQDEFELVVGGDGGGGGGGGAVGGGGGEADIDQPAEGNSLHTACVVNNKYVLRTLY